MTTTGRRSCSILSGLVLALVLAAPAAAQPGGDPVEEAFRLALLRLSQDGLLGADAVPRVIDRPAEKVANFGALVDRDEADGLRVLGTLPGGSAERIGLRTGDLLLAANGTALRGAGAGERMRERWRAWTTATRCASTWSGTAAASSWPAPCRCWSCRRCASSSWIPRASPAIRNPAAAGSAPSRCRRAAASCIRPGCWRWTAACRGPPARTASACRRAATG